MYTFICLSVKMYCKKRYNLDFLIYEFRLGSISKHNRNLPNND